MASLASTPAATRGEHRVQRGLGAFAGGELRLHRHRIAARDGEEIGDGTHPLRGLGGVVAPVPRRIGLDRVDRHLAPHPVAAGDLHCVAGEGRQSLGETGMGLSPDEGMHAAHRGAEDQLEPSHAQPLGQQPVCASTMSS
jgi:hypothetical protein